MPPGSLGRLLQHHLRQPKNIPTQPLVTQMQPPMLPPPPYPNFKSVHLTPLPVTRDPLLISYSEPPITHSQTSVVTGEVFSTADQCLLTENHLTLTSSHTQLQHKTSDKSLTESDSRSANIRGMSLASEIRESFTELFTSQPLSKPPVGRPFTFLKSDSYSVAPTQSPVTKTKNNHSGSVIQSSSLPVELHQTQSHQLLTKSQFYQFYHKPTSTQIYQTKLRDAGQPGHWKTPSPPPVTKPKQSQIHSQPLPTLPKPPSTISPLPETQSQLSPTQHPLLHSQAPLPQTEPFPLQHGSPLTTQPSVLTTYPLDQTSTPSTLDPEIPGVQQSNMSNQVQLNISKQGEPVKSAKSPNDTELTEWLKANTSQSPMTSNDPR